MLFYRKNGPVGRCAPTCPTGLSDYLAGKSGEWHESLLSKTANNENKAMSY